MSLKIGVARFLGTNCDADVMRWAQLKSHVAEYLWYEDQFDTNHFDAVIIPGGFSHGDYLRCGALAAQMPVMRSVREFAKKGKPILGICNGFQILCESGLLPGALLRNEKLKFRDQMVTLKLEKKDAYFSKTATVGENLNLPIAHGDGRYYVEGDMLKKLYDCNQIWLTYNGENPNGSLMDIAGITNESGMICALMPHPERAVFEWMGSTDGMFIL